ncbi:DinB family protein [Longimicrobium sp.]|uniref:DinB family protein n=1 Tax=Longimicrobium sp. TaxID=2029185 RepID=UPI002CD39859|nr:DinB family protein [Longimicrobium sp.]HSU15050.1 DinB family protein [Longimicrobium sp.]
MSQPEPWLRGPAEGIPPLLMPVAHALVMAREDVAAALAGLPGGVLWSRPGGAASAGFHAMHLAGSLDRLFTYARGQQLGDEQFAALAREQSPGEPPPSARELIHLVETTIEKALAQLRATDPTTLLDPREVGRQRLPSNVLGLLFHAAEHTQRHVGQVVTTARVARNLAQAAGA